VSAGQSEFDSQDGETIRWDLARAPQNIGDMPNVLVVAACQSCEGNSPALWPNSNRSDETLRYVGLLAPGGDPLPTYLDGGKVGETTGGTSSAAAFVAAQAARVSQCHFSAFQGRPKRLKEWLMLTSRPIADSAALNYVAGGIIDPDVSMLDPRKTWLKLVDRDVHTVEFQHWCKQSMPLDMNSEARRWTNLAEARRVTNTPGVGVVSYEFRTFHPTRLHSSGELIRTGPGSAADPTAPLAAVSYDGETCRVSVNDITDLILDREYEDVRDCGPLPPCQ
jgi:hypothetical protein